MLDQFNQQHRRPKRHYVIWILFAGTVIAIFFIWPVVLKTIIGVGIVLGGSYIFWAIVLGLLERYNAKQGMKNMGNFGERNSKQK